MIPNFSFRTDTSITTTYVKELGINSILFTKLLVLFNKTNLLLNKTVHLKNYESISL